MTRPQGVQRPGSAACPDHRQVIGANTPSSSAASGLPPLAGLTCIVAAEPTSPAEAIVSQAAAMTSDLFFL